MKFELDTHTHTIASGHAYSTVHDLVKEAKNIGLKMFALTDHGPAMPGGPHIYHIGNQKVIPRVIDGVFVLRGVEANIIDYDGSLDIPEEYLKELDLVIASLHDVCIKPGTREENTNALIRAMENKYVDIIAHPGNPVFPIDEEKLLKAAKKNNVLIEINNSSFGKSRPGSKENCIRIAKIAKEMNVQLSVGSDTHISFQLGKFDYVEEIFKDINMPDDLIINTSIHKLINFLEKKGKKNIKDFKELIKNR
ncbi:phosphatase [Tepidibacter thalassicus]|uniref:Putative hydrolase n=1 Tax=Tepidibacter thalassicus DSM 15285 TaxID=1123350 RepID=A0A1M5S8F3_9FIRM|nr:phosphatase [Tepidibacter thalassicus]SHH34761.1 putative hydrolase [Tepidibacter thalassicus DSM 15285]